MDHLCQIAIWNESCKLDWLHVLSNLGPIVNRNSCLPVYMYSRCSLFDQDLCFHFSSHDGEERMEVVAFGAQCEECKPPHGLGGSPYAVSYPGTIFSLCS